MVQNRTMAGAEKLERERRPRFKSFTPFGDQVAVHVLYKGETEVGLLLPEGVEDPDNTPMCKVIACGPDCKQIKEGDMLVIPNAQQGITITHGGSGRVVVFREEMLFGGVVLPAEEVSKNRAEAK